MSNQFGIPEKVERRIRQRDKVCVYCRKAMIYPCIGDNQRDWATIEHFREEGPFYWSKGLKEKDLAICCKRYNSSTRKNKLLDWFQKPYCTGNDINEKTVANPVKEYLKRNV